MFRSIISKRPVIFLCACIVSVITIVYFMNRSENLSHHMMAFHLCWEQEGDIERYEVLGSLPPYEREFLLASIPGDSRCANIETPLNTDLRFIVKAINGDQFAYSKTSEIKDFKIVYKDF